MLWQGWLLGLIAVIIFAVFVVCVLVMLHRMVRKTERLIDDLEIRLRTLDPLLRVINQVGEVVERHAEAVRRLNEVTEGFVRECKQESEPKGKMDIVSDLLQWGLLGVSVWNKFRQERK